MKRSDLSGKLRHQLRRIAHRDGGLEDHDRVRIDGHDILNDRLDRARVEVVGLGVVVGGGGEDDEIRTFVSLASVQCGNES